jgi:hypothetical protein
MLVRGKYNDTFLLASFKISMRTLPVIFTTVPRDIQRCSISAEDKAAFKQAKDAFSNS